MRIREIMRRHVVTVEPKDAASVAWSRMQRRGIRHLVVAKNGRVRGVISERDLGGLGYPDVRRGRLVEDLMTPRVVSAQPDTTLRQAANLMSREVIGCLPVMERNQLIGIVTASQVVDELGRSAIREPLPRWRPRRLKRRLGRANSRQIPAHIRLFGTNLSRDKRMYIRQKLGIKLGKFAESIERVSVRLTDENGPRGGIDQVCRIKVVLSKLPSVVFEARAASLEAAISVALAGIGRAVRRKLQRRRMKQIQGRGAASTSAAPD